MPRIAKVFAGFVVLLFIFVYAIRMPNPITPVSAALSGTQMIHGCVLLSTAMVRIVSSPASCNTLLETPLSWRQQPATGTEVPFICGGCNLSNMSGMAGVNFTGAWLRAADLSGADLSNATMTSAYLKGATLASTNLSNAHLVDANIDDSQISSSNFQDMNLTGATFLNAVISDTSFDDTTGLTSGALTGATFSNVVCPDGTNSDSNGSTCVGHLTP